MTAGKIDVPRGGTVVDEVLALIGQIEAKMPFLQSLTADEKQRLVKPHPGTKQVVEGVAELDASLGPPRPAGEAPPADPMLNDLDVYLGATRIGDELRRVLGKVDDTGLLAGSEAWNEALIRYGMHRQRQRTQPDLGPKLDRLRPLITSRPVGGSSGTTPDEPATNP